MADIIQLLPDHIANQIAAGEVVQRPASLVKELLENSIDAGAQNIRLIVKDAGKTLVQVVDDGIGMSSTDARMSFERHATSKIRCAEDLFQIRTMGFRGEALASIAAVAQVEMRTRKREQELGTRLVIEASKVVVQEPCQTAAGTSFSVKNLFYNIPARRNFLKTNQIEMRHILDEFERVALANPDIFFSLHHNDEKIHHLPKANLRQRIVHLFGNKVNQALIPVAEETDILKITGFVGKPEFARKTRGEQFFFVNNRFIKSSYLHHALMGAYEDLLPANHYPFYVIFFELDPAKIDVNVHPTKQEIKFDDERLIYNYLRVTVRHALAQNSVTPSLDFEASAALDQELSPNPTWPTGNGNDLTIEQASRQQPNGQDAGEKSAYAKNSGGSGSNSGGSSYTKPTDNPLYASNLKNWELLYKNLQTPSTPTEPEHPETEIGGLKLPSLLSAEQLDSAHQPSQKQPYQLHLRYIVSPVRSGFMLIDQNAAHQRILFEQYLEGFERQQKASQQLLFPQTVQLPTNDAILLKGILEEVNALGIDIKEFGGQTFIIHGLPSELQAGNEQRLVEQLLEQYKQNLDLKLSVHENLARALAAQSAIPHGKLLTTNEMQQLIDRLFACATPQKAPQGRKTFIMMDLEDLSKRFE